MVAHFFENLLIASGKDADGQMDESVGGLVPGFEFVSKSGISFNSCGVNCFNSAEFFDQKFEQLL